MSSQEVSMVGVPFGRARAIAAVGGLLFAAALRFSAPEVARAAHLPIPQGCYGFKECHCCSGSNCCESTCVGHSHSHGCPTGTQCWYTCVNNNTYLCCDYHVTWSGSETFCICRGWIPELTC